MLIRMVLHTIPFMNSFPRKGGLKHYPPSAIMTGAQLHMNQLQLKFGSYCQVAEDVTPHNSLAARTRAAISMGPSGNLSGGHRFLALDTGKVIVRNRWKELPMPTTVIDRVNVLGRTERSLLVFTDCQGHVIGDYAPTTVEQADAEEDESVVAPDVTPGVSSIERAVLTTSQEWNCLMLLFFTSPQEWIWVSLKQTPLKCSTMLSLILT